jgi:hypothetical protein
MRAVAGALLVLAAAIRVANRLPHPSDPDDGLGNALLTLGGVCVAGIGVLVTLNESFRRDAPSRG